ncbi:MAG: hypothetical protein IPJ38_14600 [Dechloromonas sp.]|uniref:Uncharacterized protein n=1 Tax=Candidatus Dechloromonas phosphorivorans TaxID=2899244 RepID=A0A935MWQ7_9RHOO|nr:hypothetical protein [Candidatus Dechloromonas phosphorivorans]
MANKTINLQPYFKIDEIATRWALSRDAVMSYGIDGQLKFGLFATGNLHVEVGSFGPPPTLILLLNQAASGVALFRLSRKWWPLSI